MRRTAVGLISLGVCAVIFAYQDVVPFHPIGVIIDIGFLIAGGFVPFVLGITLQAFTPGARVSAFVTSGGAVAAAAGMLLTPDTFDIVILDSWLVGAVFTFAYVFGFLEIGVAVVERWRGVRSDDRESDASEARLAIDSANGELPADSDSCREDYLGVGEFPRELDRLNWSAFFWGAFWALAYGVYPWFWGLFAVRAASVIFFIGLDRMSLGASATSTAAMVAAWAALNLGLAAWLAFRANRLLWEHRGEVSSATPPMRARTYREAQRRWARLGIILNVIVYGLGLLDGMVSTVERVNAAVAVLAVVTVWLLNQWRVARLESSEGR